MAIGGRVKGSLEVLSQIGVVVAAGTLVWAVFFAAGVNPPPPPPAEQIAAVSDLRLDAAQVTKTYGDGPVAIVEFSDYQCPYCRRHARSLLPKLQREMADRGTARYVSLHHPIEEIHPHARRAGEAAECAAMQGRFWDMHTTLFESSSLADPDLLRHAESLTLDMTTFVDCLEGGKALDRVRADLAEGQRLDVRGTPTFFIGTVLADGSIELMTRIRGLVPFEVFEREVQKAKSK